MWNFHTATHYNYESLRAFARENRKYATMAERFLWEQLRGGALGEKFLRQYIVGDYILDFVSQDSGLVIEVDGGYHAECKQQERDEDRTAFLEANGFQVIRFTNEEVLFEIEKVVEEIKQHLE